MSDKAEKIAALIARTEVFSDSKGIACTAHNLLADAEEPYWAVEVYDHIMGLWKHTRALTAMLQERAKG